MRTVRMYCGCCGMVTNGLLMLLYRRKQSEALFREPLNGKAVIETNAVVVRQEIDGRLGGSEKSPPRLADNRPLVNRWSTYAANQDDTAYVGSAGSGLPITLCSCVAYLAYSTSKSLE